MSKSSASVSPSQSSSPSRSSLSPAELEARRQNAQHSTGPKTREGKARSRFNALRHGAYASGAAWSDEALRALGEDPAEFRRLRAELRCTRAPRTTPSGTCRPKTWRGSTGGGSGWSAPGRCSPLHVEPRRARRLACSRRSRRRANACFACSKPADRAIERQTRLLLRLREADQRRDRQRERRERERLEQHLRNAELDENDAPAEIDLVEQSVAALREQDKSQRIRRRLEYGISEIGKILETAKRSGESTENKHNSGVRSQQPEARRQDLGVGIRVRAGA